MAMTPGPDGPRPGDHGRRIPSPAADSRGRLDPPVSGDARLGCGREIDDLWDSLGEPATSHERSCPSCREARAVMAPLAEATSRMRALETHEPELEPDPRVLTRVMAVARAEVRRSKRLPLDEPTGVPAALPGRAAHAHLTVSEQTVAAIARRAADSVAEVQVRRSRVELAAPADDAVPGSSATPGRAAPVVPDDAGARGSLGLQSRPARVAVSLQISIALRSAIPEIARKVRGRVRAAIAAEVGVRPVVVDINVQGVHDA